MTENGIAIAINLLNVMDAEKKYVWIITGCNVEGILTPMVNLVDGSMLNVLFGGMSQRWNKVVLGWFWVGLMIYS